MRVRPDDAGVFECACHEGDYGMRYMLEASRLADDASRAEPRQGSEQQ